MLGTELRFWDLLGRQMSISLGIFLHALTHNRTLLFTLLCMVAFIAADPSGARPFVPIWFGLGFWPVLFAFYLTIIVFCLFAVSALTRLIPNLRVPTPLIGFVALIPTIMLCDICVFHVSHGTVPRNFIGKLVIFFVMAQGLETIYFRFILPDIRKELESKEPSEPQEPGRHLVVGGEKVDMTGLLYIEAREHHVHLTFEDAKSSARARLGDVVAQTKDTDGMQPHRSWWIARDPAIRAERKNGRLVLRLRDDTEVPVARTRADEVLNWLQTHVHPAE